ncbi:MAG: GatB/YqeY domain-containing protein [Candidatus Curtissbacteria bacterium]|nr:GatB/YqeY domain-containing protein [Candidatus Curtissbacteria bacterium]
MPVLLGELNQDLTTALKAKDEVAVSALRFLIAGLHNAKIAKRDELTDEEILLEIGKAAKRHNESIEAFEAGNRQDLVQKEMAELSILQKYLPQPLTDEELEKMVDEAIAAVGASGPADLGRVMSTVLSSARTRADGGKVAEIVKRKLGS